MSAVAVGVLEREKHDMPREFRVALRTDDVGGTVRLYRDVLGYEQVADWGGEHGEGVLLALPTATLEILSTEHADHVDRIEVGGETGARIRFAIAVEDIHEVASAIEGAGVGRAAASPAITPWGDTNLRMEASGGVQLTLFSGPAG